MLPPIATSATAPERRLADLFAALGETDRHALLAFAEFLATGGARQPAPAEPAVPADPAAVIPAPAEPAVPLPRPAQERVIAAIRRLGLSYPMLERGAMLHETAALMSQHVFQGRPAAAVIDDLEALFERHYQEHLRRAADPTPPANPAPRRAHGPASHG